MTDRMMDYINTLKKHSDAGETSKIFNIAHAYLQGLEDAGIITEKEHEVVFSYITGLE